MKKIKFPLETGEFYDEEDEDLVRIFAEQDGIPIAEPEHSKQIAHAVAAAKKFNRKDKRINIRVNAHDLMHFKAKAAAEGIPYQTLLAGIIHRYVSGDVRFLK